jgi:hypothetical protein
MVPSDPIFKDQSEPEEKATDYIANPVRVQLPNSAGQADPRRWTQMDLVALANNILDRERECADLRKMVRGLSMQLSDTKRQLDALAARIDTPYSGKLARILSAIEKIANEEDDDNDEDLY